MPWTDQDQIDLDALQEKFKLFSEQKDKQEIADNLIRLANKIANGIVEVIHFDIQPQRNKQDGDFKTARILFKNA